MRRDLKHFGAETFKLWKQDEGGRGYKRSEKKRNQGNHFYFCFRQQLQLMKRKLSTARQDN